MAAKYDFPKDVESKAQGVEPDGSLNALEGNFEEVKRNLKSRHINMIAIAGMIVSSIRSCDRQRVILRMNRELVSS